MILRGHLQKSELYFQKTLFPVFIPCFKTAMKSGRKPKKLLPITRRRQS